MNPRTQTDIVNDYLHILQGLTNQALEIVDGFDILPEVDPNDAYDDLDTSPQYVPSLDDELAADRLFEWE